MRVCLYVLIVKNAVPDRALSFYPSTHLSIYLSICLPFVYRLKGRDKCLCVVWLTNIIIPIVFPSFFFLSFAIFPIEQGLRNKNVCAILYYPAVHAFLVKNIAAISTFLSYILSCRLLRIEINRELIYYSF